MKARKTAVSGLLVALALVLSYVEAQVPALFAVPGMKLGLTNIVVLFALYRLNARSAAAINLVRILLAGLLFGSGVSLAYSLCGGALSFVAMAILKRSGHFHLTTVSIVGGITHNLGQILAAIVLLQTTAIAWYLLVLWFTGIAAGIVVGLIAGVIVGRVPPLQG